MNALVGGAAAGSAPVGASVAAAGGAGAAAVAASASAATVASVGPAVAVVADGVGGARAMRWNNNTSGFVLRRMA
jgi:hypothetical protein